MTNAGQYKSLSQLAAELNDSIDRLQGGTLDISQVEHLTDTCRELYERLVVLRYKAFDQEVKAGTTAAASAVPDVVAPEEPTKEESPSFVFRVHEEETEVKTDAVPTNQVSLIDAIEEVTRNTPSAPEIQPSVPVVPPLPKFENPETVNDRLSKVVGQKESLADKLEQTPIQDLKKAISLNQRFQFSRELFKGNNQEYEVTIDRLNTAGREEAMKTLENLRSKYAWNNESPVTQDFVVLVERRYLA